MKREKSPIPSFIHLRLIWTLVWLCLIAGNALALDISVIGHNNDAAKTTSSLIDYRWLIEEDQTYHVNPNVQASDTLSVRFHQSYMPVVASGAGEAGLETVLTTLMSDNPDTHYFVSVLPSLAGSYTNGGVQVAPGQSAATVHLNKLPLETAQITIFTFKDDFPINNVPDLPEESGLPGVQILLEDGGGRYGAAAGAQSYDAFGNLLGTVYDANGDCVDDLATAEVDCLVEPLVTDANGELTIKNLAPGKYGITTVPPAGYMQTSTIEGTKIIDAWVKSGEPPYFAEFGPPGPHVFVGFIEENMNNIPVGANPQTISGQIVNLHLSRPLAPEASTAFFNGAPFSHTTPWIGLNDGAGRGIYSGPTDEDGNFAIPNVPVGDYQLAIWDNNLDLLFAFHNIRVNADGSCTTANGSCDLGEVPVFQWFSRLEGMVFNDTNQNGVRDAGEVGIPEQAINLRWRDGTLYQSFPTDSEGFAPFDEVFPFFSWLTMEVDYARLKATGATFTVDDGGAVAFGEQMTPQLQDNGIIVPDPAYDPLVNTDPYKRTEVGPVLTQGFQGFLGQTSIVEWGKAPYGPNENGGISGIVYYAITRAEDDPALAAAEPWEPGIPRVQVNLYEQDANALDDGVIADLNGNGTIEMADVDNYPLGWADGGAMSANDIDYSGDGVFDYGDALNVTWTDSWDDNPPTNCQIGNDAIGPYEFRGEVKDCFDGMRTWNQIRPGVFDGGYAFMDDKDGIALPLGIYIVEAKVPPGYELLKEEDRNVDFGDSYLPSPNLLAATCVGDDHLVPDELALFSGTPAGFAGETRPLCDRKQVLLSNGSNAAADFFLFTEAPIAGHIMGFILDDTANEFDPTAPTFGEKYAPPFLPISVRDFTGREIARTYSDEFGSYNLLVPSTYTANLPQPSGMSPMMLTACMNDPTLEDGSIDPQFNPKYSTFCYTFQFMPGSTTYLDTPVLPVAAMSGPGQDQLDCEFPEGTPRISQVTSNDLNSGPYDENFSGFTIGSAGMVEVPNPLYDGLGGAQLKTIMRDYGFGNDQGSLLLDGMDWTNAVDRWSDAEIVTTALPAGSHQLTIVRADGVESITGITVHSGPANGAVHHVGAGGSIQTAIDAAAAGDLILVAPGNYEEMLVMTKPVQLQGWGAHSTIINALNAPAEKLQIARNKIEQAITSGLADVVDGQPGLAAGDFGGIEPNAFFTEEGAGILVLGKNDGSFAANEPRIDGFTIKGASSGGGIIANGYNDTLEISNNRVINNNGSLGGGIRIGHPQLTVETADGGLSYSDAHNDNIYIHNNHVTQNGALNGNGAGISMNTGSDLYAIVDNYICGNNSMGDGGGIGHLGFSEDGVISDNIILFNESFVQGTPVHGGGIAVIGQQPLAGNNLSPGTGNLIVSNNLIRGNLAGAGDGGGIYLNRANGEDVAASNRKSSWNQISLFNNMIVNNVAAMAGGGVSLQDSLNTYVVFNTIANNDSTATAGAAFLPNSGNRYSEPQPAGLVAHRNSLALADEVPGNSGTYTVPYLRNNILWHNRSFHFQETIVGNLPSYGLVFDGYDDLIAPANTGGDSPRYSLFSLSYTGPSHSSNILTDDAGFVNAQVNLPRDNTVTPNEPASGLDIAVAFDEGGNFIQVRFGPLTPTGNNPYAAVDPGYASPLDYHLINGALAIGGATRNLNNAFADIVGSNLDIDGEIRDNSPDIGADEYLGN